MEPNVPTLEAERPEKTASELQRGDWIGLWWPSKVLLAERYTERSKERVCVVAYDPNYLRPEVFFFDAEFRVSLAGPEEIPEDEWASGRDIAEPFADVPADVEGFAPTGRA